MTNVDEAFDQKAPYIYHHEIQLPELNNKSQKISNHKTSSFLGARPSALFIPIIIMEKN